MRWDLAATNTNFHQYCNHSGLFNMPEVRQKKKKEEKKESVDESSNGSTPRERHSVHRSYFGKPIKVYRQPNKALLFSFRARERRRRRRRQPREGCRDTSSSHLICNLREATTLDSCARVRDKVWCHQPKYLRGDGEEVPGRRRRRRTCVSLLLPSFTRASVTAAELRATALAGVTFTRRPPMQFS